MKLSKLSSALAATSALTFCVPASASIDGWFDYVDVGMVDIAVGWVCDNWLPTQTPLGGVLAVYVNGTHHSDYPLNSNNWGSYRGDAAYRCNGYQYSGFHLMNWFSGSTIAVYFRDNSNVLHPLGRPINITGPGRNW